MPYIHTAYLRAAAAIAVLWVSGCSTHGDSSSLPESVTPSPTTVTAFRYSGPLPAAEALTDVMYRLADAAVPGSDKLQLIENASPSEAAALDNFAAALRDGGFTPVTVTATDIRWSDADPGDTLATIKVTTTNPGNSNPGNPGEFTFPMEFRPTGDGWQLTRETADMLLEVGNARTGPTTPSATAPR
jgi:hypothetical protein